MKELDRIFDRENVLMPLFIDLVNYGSQSCRFPRAGWSGHQDQTARLVAQLFDDRRQTKLFERLDLVWDRAKYCADRPALIENIRAETRQAFYAETEIQFQVLFETMLLRVCQNRVRQLLRL